MDTSSPGLGFDPRDPAFIANPYPAYRRLREQAPLWRSPAGPWILTRYADILQVLSDHHRAGHRPVEERFQSLANEPCVAEFSKMMGTRNPPDHTRLRALVSKAFAARRIERMRERVQEIADTLFSRLNGARQMDVIRDLAHPLPLLVICELIGIPESDLATFRRSAVAPPLLRPTPPTRNELDAANEATLARRAYFGGLLELRRREPREDLATLLVQAEMAGDRLTTDEMFANIAQLFFAGHETTVNLIGNGILSLQRNREQWELLCGDPTLVPSAVEELLRYESPVQLVPRTILRPLELAEGRLAEGDAVIAVIAAANRDPAVFDDPERLDVTRNTDANRQTRPALGFGRGIHFCVGSQLARLEAEVVLSELLRRMPNMVLPAIDKPQWRNAFPLRGLETLPATW